MTSPTIDELIGRLERLRTHQADYEEIEETAAKTQEALRRLVEERDEWKGAHDDVRQFHDACIKELYRILNVDGSDGEFRFKWAALEVSALRSHQAPSRDAGWISVEERKRLPKLGITVLFYVDDGVTEKGILTSEGWIADDDVDGRPTIGVTHWQPLPASPYHKDLRDNNDTTLDLPLEDQ